MTIGFPTTDFFEFLDKKIAFFWGGGLKSIFLKKYSTGLLVGGIFLHLNMSGNCYSCLSAIKRIFFL